MAHPRRQLPEYVADRDAHASDARLATPLSGFQRDDVFVIQGASTEKYRRIERFPAIRRLETRSGAKIPAVPMTRPVRRASHYWPAIMLPIHSDSRTWLHGPVHNLFTTCKHCVPSMRDGPILSAVHTNGPPGGVSRSPLHPVPSAGVPRRGRHLKSAGHRQKDAELRSRHHRASPPWHGAGGSATIWRNATQSQKRFRTVARYIRAEVAGGRESLRHGRT